MRKWRAAALLAGICIATPVRAFGLRSHLWIADEVFQDLADCSLTIQGRQFRVPHETCELVRADPGRFRANFLAGSLGPDVFPDLVVGQTIIHPGANDGQKGANFWLDRLLTDAARPDEIAFAWGFAMHYAGDSFAHSYVNNYAGDVFELFTGGTPNVELRHFRLEKYIDQLLDYRPPVDQLQVPAAFLARELIQFDYSRVQGVSRLSSAHMRTMGAALALAREARARAPSLAAESRARVLGAANALERTEDELGLTRSNGASLDRRSQPQGISARQWRALRAAHERYEEEVDRANRDRGLERFTEAWVADVEKAFELYIEASLAFGRSMADMGGQPVPYRGRDSMLQPYRDWARCYGNVLRGVPLAVGDATCAHLRALGAEMDFGEAALRATAGRAISSIYLDMLDFNRWLQRRLVSVAIDLATIADRNVARLVRELTDPAHVDATALNSAFLRSDNGQLAFNCVKDWVDADLGLYPNQADVPADPRAACSNAPRRATMNPYEFRPLAYAVTLAKVAMLDHAGLRQLARDFGSDPAELRMSDRGRYSLLIDGVRSLDGSHQWQSVSLPFPRRTGAGRRPFVTAGYGQADAPAKGFPLYQTYGLRSGVFAALFPAPFEGHILTRPEMRWPAYPFRPCAGDPLRAAPAEAEMVGCPEDRRLAR